MAPRMISQHPKWPVPTDLLRAFLGWVGFSDFDLLILQVASHGPGPNPVPWRPLLPRAPHCLPADRGGVFALFRWGRGAGGGVLSCPPWRGDPHTSYPIHLPLLFTRWSLGESPFSPRLGTWKNLGRPPSPWPHIKASTQANCSDTSTRQAGSRMAKDTGSGIRLPSWHLTPKIGDCNPGQHTYPR